MTVILTSVIDDTHVCLSVCVCTCRRRGGQAGHVGFDVRQEGRGRRLDVTVARRHVGLGHGAAGGDGRGRVSRNRGGWVTWQPSTRLREREKERVELESAGGNVDLLEWERTGKPPVLF